MTTKPTTALIGLAMSAFDKAARASRTADSADSAARNALVGQIDAQRFAYYARDYAAEAFMHATTVAAHVALAGKATKDVDRQYEEECARRAAREVDNAHERCVEQAKRVPGVSTH